MSTKYIFSSEEIAAIQEARKRNKDKRVEKRLRALEECAQGKRNKEIAGVCGFHPRYISSLVSKYREGGLEAITGNHYGGNHRNMSIEDEAALLERFRAEAQEGKLIEISEIESAYRDAVKHEISSGQIYRVLARHGWRKVMPRSRHPKKASEEVIETSKKLTRK